MNCRTADCPNPVPHLDELCETCRDEKFGYGHPDYDGLRPLQFDTVTCNVCGATIQGLQARDEHMRQPDHAEKIAAASRAILDSMNALFRAAEQDAVDKLWLGPFDLG